MNSVTISVGRDVQVDRGFLEKLYEKNAQLVFHWADRLWLPVLHPGDATVHGNPVHMSIGGITSGRLLKGTPMLNSIIACLEGCVDRERVPLLLAKMGPEITVTHYRQVLEVFLRKCYEAILEADYETDTGSL